MMSETIRDLEVIAGCEDSCTYYLKWQAQPVSFAAEETAYHFLGRSV